MPVSVENWRIEEKARDNQMVHRKLKGGEILKQRESFSGVKELRVQQGCVYLAINPDTKILCSGCIMQIKEPLAPILLILYNLFYFCKTQGRGRTAGQSRPPFNFNGNLRDKKGVSLNLK